MLTRAQLLMGDSSQGPVLAGQVQAVKAGSGISIDATGTITVNSQSIVGVMKLGQTVASAAGAYNSYEWPTTAGTAGQQITIQSVGAVTTLAWDDPDQIPWTAKGQLIVGTGLGTQDLLNVGTNGQILIADSSTTTGLAYTGNYVATSGPTSAANLPAGAPALRPATPPAGAFRYNSTDTSLEFYNGVAWETVASSATNNFVEKTNDTGIALIPAGSTVQRPAAGLYAGAFRFNTDLDTLEFSDGTNWIQLVMLNNSVGYNSYIWPSADGAFGAFLQTDAAGTLSWSQPAFVGSVAPSPASDGMLWFDCNVGYFKVYQSCVSPVGWTKVAEPGLPVLPSNTSAAPAFTGGSGTSASPYIYSTTTVAAGSSIFILNIVTITGLAPNQFVPIIDLNAVTNGGRFSFSNNTADNSGTLVFQVIFKDQPTSPPATSYTAAIKVGYGTVFANVVVNIVAALSVTAGSIAGTPQVGSTLTYTPGVASGGVPPSTTAWVWKSGTTTVGTASSTTYVPVTGDIGAVITVVITATDAVSATATATTAPTATILNGLIPTACYNPVPVTGPTASNTTATGTWNCPSTTLTSAGCIQISINGGAYSQGPTPVATGDSVDMRWINSVSCTGAPNGTVITGTITASSGGVNTYSLTLSTAPTGFSFTDVTGQAPSTAVTSAVTTIGGTNVNTFLTTTGGTLTAIQASIGGGAFAAIPASGTTMPVQPGQTIQIRGTTGATVSTGYTAILALGTATTTWTATTAALVPVVTTPSILTPVNGATDLNPILNSPSGITATSSAFASSNGAGTNHVSSDWQFATDASFTTVVYSVTASTTEKVSARIPMANLAVSTTYYVRVRYTSGTDGGGVVTTSSYSAGSSFSTAASFDISPGTPMAGGYFGGQIKVFAGQDGGGLPAVDTIYNLIVCPVNSGSLNGQFGGAGVGSIQYKTSQSADAPDAVVTNLVYGGLTTDLLKTSGSHPVFANFINVANGPNAGAFDLATGGAGGGTGIGGYNDWYLPALYEQSIIFFFLKPDGPYGNNTNYGSNPNSLPPYTPNTPYSNPDFPGFTTSALFSNGSQAYSHIQWYWTSSQTSPGSGSAYGMDFYDGTWAALDKSNSNRLAKAIRRVLA